MEVLNVKEEPFESFLSQDSKIENCCLCIEGTKLQNLLIQHIQSKCNEALRGCETKLTTCFCPEGLQIQTDLINHLLSHFMTKNESQAIELEELSLVPIEETYDIIKLTKERDARDPMTKRFFCKICEKSFQYKQGLHKHFDNEHNPEKIRVKIRRMEDPSLSKIPCQHCPKEFKYKQGLQKHWDLEHNPTNLFACPKNNCFSRCKTLKNLHAHLRVHDPPRKEGLDNLQCDKCMKMFSSQKQLSLHYYTHREKFFCCDMCGSRFNNREQIKQHLLRHVGLFQKKTVHQRIICDQCSTLVFTHKMKRHKMIHHSSEKPFKCDSPGCKAAFSDQRILSDHMNIHLKLKPYKCEYCSEAFRSSANLRLHRVRHTDPDRYHCRECQTSFVTKQALQKHNRRHCDDPELRPFACEYPGCNSTFRQKDHVRSHVRRLHEKTDEIFYCELCEKSYEKKDALGKHLRKAHNISKRKSRVFPLT